MGESVPVLEDLPSVRGEVSPGAHGLQRSDVGRPHHRRPPDSPVARDPDLVARPGRGRGHDGQPPRPARRAGPIRPTTWIRSAGASRSCCRHRRRRHPGPGAAEPPLRPPGGGGRSELRRRAGGGPGPVRQRGFRGGPPGPRLGRRSARDWLPSAGGRALVREVEVLGGLLQGAARPFVAVLGGIEGERQARGHRGPARSGRHPARRRRHVLHLPGRPGTPDRGLALRSRLCRGLPPPAGLRPDPDSQRPHRPQPRGQLRRGRAKRRGPPGRARRPRRLDRPRHRSGHRRGVRRRHRRSPHHPLERSHGRLRGSPVRGRDQNGGRGGGGRGRLHASSAGGTPPRPWPASGWPSGSTTSPAAAGRRSSSSRRATSPGWRPCGRGSRRDPGPRAGP